jgi:protocatechuate 3,4-dioxygenase alpha subunit
MTQDAGRPVATPSQTVGPFFHFGLTANAALGTLAKDGVRGERIQLRIRVLDRDGPVPDAMVEIYQADPEGQYGQAPFDGFGRLPTDGNGTCMFVTIRPGAVSNSAEGAQAAHVNVCLFARGLLRHVYTRIYFSGDPAVDEDPLMALVPPERRSTLLASQPSGEAAVWEFTIRLQGERETVFFAL